MAEVKLDYVTSPVRSDCFSNLRPGHITLLERAGMNLAALDTPAGPLVSAPSGQVLHRPSCATAGARTVQVALTVRELARHRLHENCTRYANPIPNRVEVWLVAAVSVATVVDALAAAEAAGQPNPALAAELTALRGRVARQLDLLCGDPQAAAPAQVLPPAYSRSEADQVMARVDALIAGARIGPRLEPYVPALLGPQPPAASLRHAAAQPGTGANVVVTALWTAWRRAIGDGADRATAAAAVDAAFAKFVDDRRWSHGPLNLGQLVGYWEAEAAERLAAGRAEVVIGLSDMPSGSGPARQVVATFPSWPLGGGDRSSSAVAVVPEVVADWLSVHSATMVRFGPAGPDPGPLAEIVAGLWDGGPAPTCWQAAQALVASPPGTPAG